MDDPAEGELRRGPEELEIGLGVRAGLCRFPLGQLAEGLPRHLGVHHARGHDIHPYSPLREGGGELLGHHLQCLLGHVVGQADVPYMLRPRAGDEEHVASGAPSHGGEDCLCEVEGAEEIDVEHGLELRLGRLRDVAEPPLDSGVMHQDVQITERPLGLGNGTPHLVRISGVALQRDAAPA